MMDKQLVKRFKRFQKKTGKYLDFKLEDIEFELEYLGNSSRIIFNPQKSNKMEALIAKDALVSFVPMMNVDEVKGIVAKYDSKNIKSVLHGSYRHFENGDILFAKVTPCMENGNCAIVENLENGVGFGSSEFYVFRTEADVSNQYVYIFLRQESLRAAAKKTFTGSGGLKRVPKSFFDNTFIPIPKSQNDSYTSLKIQEVLVEFIEFYKKDSDAKLGILKDIRTTIAEIERMLLPLFFAKHPSVQKRFDAFCKKKKMGLRLAELDFEPKRIHSDTKTELICKKRMGFTPDRTTDGTVNWFTVSDLTKNVGLYINNPDTKEKTNIELIKKKVSEKSDKFLPIKKGDVLVSFKLTVGLVKIYNADLPAYCNEAIDILTPIAGVDSRFLAYNCMIEYLKYGEKTNNGVTLNDDHKKQITIGVPKPIRDYDSLQIQQIIVDFIESYHKKMSDKRTIADTLKRIFTDHTRFIITKTFKNNEQK